MAMTYLWRFILVMCLCLSAALAAFSPARAQTFSPATNISNTPGDSFNSAVAVDGLGNVYVVWADGSAGTPEILFTRSVGGGSFSAPRAVSQGVGESFQPNIAVDKFGVIYIVWVAGDTNDFGTFDVFFTKSTDGGTTFAVPVNVFTTSASSLLRSSSRGRGGREQFS